MKEKERQYLDGVFGGNYQENKHKKEYAHIDLYKNNQSGIKKKQDEKLMARKHQINQSMKMGAVDLYKRGVINEAQMNRIHNVLG